MQLQKQSPLHGGGIEQAMGQASPQYGDTKQVGAQAHDLWALQHHRHRIQEIATLGSWWPEDQARQQGGEQRLPASLALCGAKACIGG